MKITVDVHIDEKKGETITIVKQSGKAQVITLHTLLESNEITVQQAQEKLDKGNFKSKMNLYGLQINL